jgi:GntR family transcriptional regulator, transcriptional repressor for pyruvate dehydrogenase complex
MLNLNLEAAGNKVYIEIVKKIRLMIEEDGLKPSDKIPSERELSERLQVGRSSVREALRALELLGLIETRRGEGTFLRDARSNQLVQLLSTFILQDEKAKLDVKNTKYLIEMDCLRIILQRNNYEEQILRFQKAVESLEIIKDDDFFLKLVEIADNHLIYRIWIILSDFYRSLNLKQEYNSKAVYLSLLDAILQSNEEKVLQEYRSLRNLSSDK